jgi:hypothetical protein
VKTRDFLETLADLVRQQLPPGFREFDVAGPSTTLIKLHYQNPSVHYEVWVQKRRRQVELGLHFEGAAESNLRHLELISRHWDDIQSSLGAGMEFEHWGRGWTRAHETLALEPLDDDFLIEVSFKLSELMRTLEPLMRGEAARSPVTRRIRAVASDTGSRSP